MRVLARESGLCKKPPLMSVLARESGLCKKPPLMRVLSQTTAMRVTHALLDT